MRCLLTAIQPLVHVESGVGWSISRLVAKPPPTARRSLGGSIAPDAAATVRPVKPPPSTRLDAWPTATAAAWSAASRPQLQQMGAQVGQGAPFVARPLQELLVGGPGHGERTLTGLRLARSAAVAGNAAATRTRPGEENAVISLT